MGPVFLGMPEPAGKYELRAMLGQGSFGTVYLGHQRDLDRTVAVKELLPRLAGDPAYIERFRAEAEVMARLNSVHCVRVYDFLEVDGRALLVSEFVDGASLQAVIEQSGKLTPEQALGVLKGALTGLADANDDGLVHRDIKPANLLADRDGVSKLADFGQAYAVGGDDPFGGGATGTPAYMSPEQVRGEAVDHRSDIYSCGAVLYELLCGQAPFVAATPAGVMRKHLQSPPPDPRRVDRTLPSGVGDLVQRAMAKDRDQRPAGARELLVELEAVAVAAYGEDWESRASIRGLVEAAALALGLLGLAASTGSAAAGSAAVASATVGGAAAGGTGAGAAGGALGAGGALAAPAGAGGGAAAAGAALRSPSLARRLFTLPVGGVLAAAVVALLGVAGLLHVGPFAPSPGSLPASLASAFGPTALGNQGVPGVSPGAPAFFAGPGGSLVERVSLVSAPEVALGFSYCDAFVCGNSDNIDCIGNSYVPGFGNAVPLTARFTPPAGAQLQKVLVTGGPSAGTGTELALFDPSNPSGSTPPMLTGQPAVGPDGRVALEFATPWRKDLQPHYNPRLARYCGFSSAQRAAFAARYGTSYHNPYPVITILVRWLATVPLDGASATLDVNGASQKTPVRITAAPPSHHALPVLLQTDPRWASTKAGGTTYGAAGTVATAVASVLSAMGAPIDPPAVGADLVRAGAWKPSQGTDWNGLLGYINQRDTASEVDLPTAALNAQSGRLALAALTDSSGGVDREVLVVITGYDPGNDAFTVVDPRVGQAVWSWARMSAANPWVMSVDPRSAP